MMTGELKPARFRINGKDIKNIHWSTDPFDCYYMMLYSIFDKVDKILTYNTEIRFGSIREQLDKDFEIARVNIKVGRHKYR